MKSVHKTLSLHIDLVTRSQVDEVLRRIATRYKVLAYRGRKQTRLVTVVIEVGLVGWLLGLHRRARADYLEIARTRGVEIVDYTATARLNLRIDVATLHRRGTAWLVGAPRTSSAQATTSPARSADARTGSTRRMPRWNGWLCAATGSASSSDQIRPASHRTCSTSRATPTGEAPPAQPHLR